MRVCGGFLIRLDLNLTGILFHSIVLMPAVAGDDGEVRLWKANYLDHWKCIATLKGDGQSQQIHPQAQVRNVGGQCTLILGLMKKIILALYGGMLL